MKLFEKIQSLDRFEIRTSLERFSFPIQENESTERLRLQLKKVLIEEILKDDISEENFFRGCLLDTLSALAVSQVGYGCCLSGCRFQGERHRNYIVHLNKDHPNIKSVLCNFAHLCKRTFSGVPALVQHLKESHASKPQESLVRISGNVAQVNIPVKCNMIQCGSRQFNNTNELMTHFNTYHSSDDRQCIFEGCNVSFTKNTQSRNHFRLQHKYKGKLNLKPNFLVNPEGQISVNLGEASVRDHASDDLVSVGHASVDDANVCSPSTDMEDNYGQDDLDNIQNAENNELNEDYYLHYYADFLNRCQDKSKLLLNIYNLISHSTANWFEFIALLYSMIWCNFKLAKLDILATQYVS